MSIDSDLRRNMAETAVLRRERRERGGATAYGSAANLRWRIVEKVLRRRTAERLFLRLDLVWIDMALRELTEREEPESERVRKR
ncbi:hypothetical protein CsSME_00009283 [Camellia sinensis var. sinensis]